MRYLTDKEVACIDITHERYIIMRSIVDRKRREITWPTKLGQLSIIILKGAILYEFLSSTNLYDIFSCTISIELYKQR